VIAWLGGKLWIFEDDMKNTSHLFVGFFSFFRPESCSTWKIKRFQKKIDLNPTFLSWVITGYVHVEKWRKRTIPLTIFDIFTYSLSFLTSIFFTSANFDAFWKKNWVDLVKICRFYDGQTLSQNVSSLHRKLRNWRVSLHFSSVLTQCRLGFRFLTQCWLDSHILGHE
jgi:hypothetical protein